MSAFGHDFPSDESNIMRAALHPAEVTQLKGNNLRSLSKGVPSSTQHAFEKSIALDAGPVFVIAKLVNVRFLNGEYARFLNGENSSTAWSSSVSASPSYPGQKGDLSDDTRTRALRPSASFARTTKTICYHTYVVSFTPTKFTPTQAAPIGTSLVV